jgi:hypothetical protein
MSKWKDILKEDWKERLKRIEEANKKTRGPKGFSKPKKDWGVKGGEKASRKKVTCDMCGKLIHVRSAREGSTDTGLKYCKQCAKARGV